MPFRGEGAPPPRAFLTALTWWAILLATSGLPLLHQGDTVTHLKRVTPVHIATLVSHRGNEGEKKWLSRDYVIIISRVQKGSNGVDVLHCEWMGLVLLCKT